MKITYIAQDVDGVTGLGRIALAYARGMIAAGHEVDVICQRCTASDLDAVKVPGFPMVKSADKFLFRAGERRASRGRAGDIRHAFGIGSWAHVVSAQSCHRSGVEMQQALPPGRHRRRNFGLYDRLSLEDERRLMSSSRTRMILAVSGLVRDQLIRWYDVPPGKITVVPNGIDAGRYAEPLDHEQVRGWFGMPANSLVLGFLGNEFDRKGVQTIIEALPHLRDIPLEVFIAGADDPAPYRRRAEQLSVSDRTHFVGRVTNPEEFLRVLDVFVFPVHYEPFGMVVTEAMAAGVPVITARAVGAVEGMTDGREGLFLADPLSASELATAIRRLASDDILCERVAKAGKTAASAFEWPSICGRIEQIYRGLVLPDGRAG